MIWRKSCDRREVRLPPASLAWLAWWASNAIAGQAMQHWRDADAQPYLDIYERVVGQDADALERACERLKDGMEKAFFEENNAKLERALREQLGPAATPYLLAREGKRPHTRRGLSLSADAITLIQSRAGRP